MAFPAFLDTCVLFGQAQCDVLLSLVTGYGQLIPAMTNQTLTAVDDMLARNQRPPRDYAQLAEWLARADAPRFGAQLLRRAQRIPSAE